MKEFTESDCLLMLTAEGMIKKTPLQRFEKMQASGLSAIKLRVRRSSELSCQLVLGASFLALPDQIS